MNIVITGLGIIGGSFAKAIKKYTGHRVIGINRSEAPAATADMESDSTSHDLPEAWLGSTTTGRWDSFLRIGMAEISSVLRVYVS